MTSVLDGHLVDEQQSEDAPFGRKPDGSPYKRDPKIYQARSQRARAGRAGGTAAGPSRKSRPNSSKQETDERRQARAQAVTNLLAAPTGTLAAIGQGVGSAALLADAVVLSENAVPLADAIAGVAEQDHRIAHVVDQIVKSTPWTVLGAVVGTMALQIAANHSTATAAMLRPLGLRTADEVLQSVLPPERE